MSFTPLERHQLQELGFNSESSREGIEEALGKLRRMAPRCETCRWWEQSWGVWGIEADPRDYGECLLTRDARRRRLEGGPDIPSMATGTADGYEVAGAALLTNQDFGCIQWEPKKRRGG